MNVELAMEKIDACVEMLLQIKSDLKQLEKVKEETVEEPKVTKPETFVGDDGREYNPKEPYLSKGVLNCCGQPCKKIEDTIYQCEKCNSKYRWS